MKLHSANCCCRCCCLALALPNTCASTTHTRNQTLQTPNYTNIVSIIWHGKCISMHLEIFFFLSCVRSRLLAAESHENIEMKNLLDFCRMQLHEKLLNDTFEYACVLCMRVLINVRLHMYAYRSVSALSRKCKWLQ